MAFRLNLICHGMMLFLYKNDEEHFTILLPKPPQNGSGENLHELSLTTVIGNTTDRNLLKDGSLSYVLGNYDLQLEPAGRFVRGASDFAWPPSVLEHIVLHKTAPLTVNQGTFDPADPVWFVIRIPYPTQVRGLRPIEFPNRDPYHRHNTDPNRGRVAKHFDIAPDVIAGVHVLTYTGVTSATLQTPHATETLSSNGAPHLNLHLYSEEPAGRRPSSGHISQFNRMVGFKTQPGGSPVAFDLERNGLAAIETPYSAPREPTDLENDLTLADLQSLGERVSASSVKGAGRVARFLAIDPVECLQGWGT